MSYSLNAMTARQIAYARARQEWRDETSERMVTAADMRDQAAQSLAADFGDDISEWTV